MTPRPPSDQAARDRARGDLDSSLVVEAGAGTGKTTVLVARILSLLGAGKAPLDRIAAITFTERAAGELKVRLREGIERERRAAAEGARGTWEQALVDLERAPIETIHAFAARLIRARPIEARVDPRFETLDELKAGLLAEEAWQGWLEEALPAAPPALARAWRAGIRHEAWYGLAAQLRCRRVDLAPPAAPADPPPAARPWLRERLERARKIRERLRAAAIDLEDKYLPAVDKLLSALEEDLRFDEDDAPGRLLVPMSVPARNRGSAKSYRPSALEEARTAFAALAEEHERIRRTSGDHLLRDLLATLWGYVERYERLKHERGALDFDDLLLRARDLLVADREARRLLAREYRYLLVDEFQDTDPLQAEIVFLLCDEAGAAASWREVEPRPGKLFLVGDPKQSIYRFRRADIEIYEQAKALVLGGAAPLRIAENFRSDAGLVDLVNAVFSGRMKRPEDGGSYQPDYAPLAAYHAERRGPALVTLVLAEPPGAKDGKVSLELRREGEGQGVAGLLRAAVEQGWPVCPREGPPRPIGFGDMVLLFRAMTGAEHYEQALRAAGIPYLVLGGKDYYRRAEVQALLRLLEAVLDPEAQVAVVAALRSSFFGVSDPQLLAHAAKARSFVYTRVSSELPEIEEAFALLRELRAARHERRPSALIRLALARTCALPAAALKPHGEQRVGNLFKIAEQAAALEQAGLDSLGAVLAHLKDLETRGAREAESLVAEEGEQTVRLMTVHKAKGLEFPLVVLPDLARESGNHGEALLIDRAARRVEARVGPEERAIETAGYAGLCAGEERRAEAERLRLQYVALTRARDYLVLPIGGGETRGMSSGKAESLELLAGFVPGLGDPAACRCPCGTREVRQADLAPPAAEAVFRSGIRAPFEPGEAGREGGLARRRWEDERGARLARAARGVDLIHPSRRKAAPGDAEPEPQELAEPPAPVLALGPGIRIGLAVHAALERADFADPRSALAAARALAASHDLAGAQAERVLRLVRAGVESDLAGEIRSARALAREVPFAAGLGTTRIEGAADLVLDDGRELVIVDWKTDAAAARGQGEVERLAAHYRPQALLYALAFESAAGRPVRETVLVFLDGPGGRAQPQRIAFDARARAEARELAGLPG